MYSFGTIMIVPYYNDIFCSTNDLLILPLIYSIYVMLFDVTCSCVMYPAQNSSSKVREVYSFVNISTTTSVLESIDISILIILDSKIQIVH
jgi:hypothetical protein